MPGEFSIKEEFLKRWKAFCNTDDEANTFIKKRADLRARSLTGCV
jgi:hypothetical protein